VDSVADGRPEWVGMRISRLGLLEIECTRSISGASCKRITHCRRASPDRRAIFQGDVEVAEVDKLMEGFYDLALDRRKCRVVLPKRIGALILTPSDLVIGSGASVFSAPVWSPTVAWLRLVAAEACLEIAHLTSVVAILAVRSEDIWRRVADIRLTEASNKFGIAHGCFEKAGSHSLVIASDESVVTVHASAVNGEPGKHTDVFRSGFGSMG